MNTADITTTIDVLSDVDEGSDSLSIEDATETLEALKDVMAALRMTISLVETQLVNTLESPRVINGNQYEIRQNDGKWRPDHLNVDAAVIHAAILNKETGELLAAHPAVEEAVRIMADLYRSANTMPKVGGLDRLNLKKWDVAEQEKGKRTLKVTPVAEAPG